MSAPYREDLGAAVASSRQAATPRGEQLLIRLLGLGGAVVRDRGPVDGRLFHRLFSRRRGRLCDAGTHTVGSVHDDPTLLVHEIGHACGLLHRRDQTNLLHPFSGRGGR